MKFEELGADIQIIAANTLKDVLVSGNYDGYEQSATDAAIHVRTAFEVLFGKELSDSVGSIVVSVHPTLKEMGEQLRDILRRG